MARSLAECVDRIEQLKNTSVSEPEFKVWRGEVERLLKKIYGNESDEYTQFSDISFYPHIVSTATPESEITDYFNKGLETAKLQLNSYLLEIVDEQVQQMPNFDPKKIFIVHGRDDVSRQELSKILEDEFELEPIVLMDEPSGGKTVIEKFESHSLKVGFAFVLLTPDDVGCLKNDIIKYETAEEKIKELHDRARENVILELGYFIGKLGRERVCCIEKGNLLPSDLHGIITIRYNSNVKEVFLDIKKELQNAMYVK